MSERDRSWFDEIYNGHYLDIVRYGVRRLAEVDASADLAQEVFAVAWRRREQVPDNSLPWLYGWPGACWPTTAGRGAGPR